MQVKLHDCLVKSGDAGVLVSLAKPVHIEGPFTGLLTLLTGGFVSLVSPNKSKKTGPFALTIEQKAGVQGISACEGGMPQTLEASISGSGPLQTGIETREATMTFAAAEEVGV